MELLAKREATRKIATLRLTYSAEIDNLSTFKTFGVDRGAAESYLSTSEGREFLNQLRAADPVSDMSIIYERALNQLGSGSGAPKMLTTNSPLVKIVPQGQKVSDYSPFFTTEADLKVAEKSGRSLADYFGLPIKSEAKVYDVYKISPSTPSTVFVSKVAPATELGGLMTRPGGATQYVVPNRGSWSAPELVGTIKN